MAQKLRDDKIGTLQHSAGNIQMLASTSSPAYLTIGGQQYKITSTLVVALPAMTANTRYQVFAVQSGGVVSLVISQNENSVGPVGYTRWKLVGSLYSNGMPSVAFGSFVNIKGVPKTEMISGGVLQISAHTTPPTKGTTSIDRMQWVREGNRVRVYFEYTQTGAGASGTGNYFFGVPFAIDSSRYTFNSDSFSGVAGQWNANSKVGEGHIGAGNSMSLIAAQPYSSTLVRLWAFNATTAGWSTIGGPGSNFYSLSGSDVDLGFELDYQSSSLSNTQIEDL